MRPSSCVSVVVPWSLWFLLVSCSLLLFWAPPSEAAPLNESYIVGGVEATPHEFPWQVSLLKSNNRNGWFHACGASILNSRWLVTAAHCVYPLRPLAEYRFVVGAHNLRDMDNNVQIKTASNIVMHQGYDDVNLAHDLAVVKLSSPLRLDGRTARAVRLAEPSENEAHFRSAPGGRCVISGWGRTSPESFGPDRLRKADVNLIPPSVCAQKYRHVRNAFIRAEMVCAGGEAPVRRNTCSGDSGGPLVCFGGANSPAVLVGATSFGVRCGTLDHPGVFTRLSAYRTWIERNTSD